MGQSLIVDDGALYVRDVAIVSMCSAAAGAGIGWYIAGKDGIWPGVIAAAAIIPATAIGGIWLAAQLRARRS